MEEKFSCGGCSRGCTIKITEEDGKIYIEGNKCIGGEQQIRQNRPELADRQFFKAEDRQKEDRQRKKGLLGRLFSK